MPPPLQDEMELLLAQTSYAGDTTDFQEIAQFIWGVTPVYARVVGVDYGDSTVPHWLFHWSAIQQENFNSNQIRERYIYELKGMLGIDQGGVEDE